MDPKSLEGGRMAMMKRGDDLIQREQAKSYIEGHMDEATRRLGTVAAGRYGKFYFIHGNVG